MSQASVKLEEMPMSLCISKVWELLDQFRDECQLKGWKTSEHEDWVETGDGEYHNFLWIQTVHHSTFEKISENRKVAVRKVDSYQVIDVSYTAWLFLQSPPENLTQTVRENPELSIRTAMYDLSRAFTVRPLCSRLNETDSIVFKEFEKFLEEELGVEVKPVTKLPVLDIHGF